MLAVAREVTCKVKQLHNFGASSRKPRQVAAMVVPLSAFLMRTVLTKRLFLGAMGAFFAGKVVAVCAIFTPLAGRVFDRQGAARL